MAENFISRLFNPSPPSSNAEFKTLLATSMYNQRKENVTMDESSPASMKITPIIPRISPDKLESAYFEEPTIFNSINKVTQLIISAGYQLEGPPRSVKFFEEFFSQIGYNGGETDWEDVLESVFKGQFIFGNAWIEKISAKGDQEKIVDLEVIDPKYMDYAKDRIRRIAVDKYLNPIGYTQSIPFNYQINQKYIVPEEVMLYPNQIYFTPESICHFKLFTAGDRFYPVGLVEPGFRAIVRKLAMEEALANAVNRTGFPIRKVKVGDLNHEPTEAQIAKAAEEVKNMEYMHVIAYPYWVDTSLDEARNPEKLQMHLKYYTDQIVTSTGLPKSIATGAGEECYSEDTQTLTENGWKYYWEILDDEKIATVNPETGNMEFHLPTMKKVHPYDGLMHHYHSSICDFLVTPEHELFFRTIKDETWRKEKSNKITQKGIIVKNFVNYPEPLQQKTEIIIPSAEYDPQSRQPNENERIVNIDDFIEFVGYFISEGSIDNYCIELSNINEKNLEKMFTCIERLGYFPSYHNARGRKEGVRFSSKAVATWLTDNVGKGCKDKKIPFVDLTKKQIQILLDSLILGDGSYFGTTGFVYYSVCKKLVDEVGLLAMRLGFAVSFKEYDCPSGSRVCRIYGNKTHLTPLLNKKKNFSLEQYSGIVYCFEVPNHLFITRRNGKVSIQGNTNRSTLGRQEAMTKMALKDVVRRTLFTLQKNIIIPIAEYNNIPPVTIRWGEISIEELDSKSKRLVSYVGAGLLTPDARIESLIRKDEDLPELLPNESARTKV